MCMTSIDKIVQNICNSYGATATLDYDFAVAATINDKNCSLIAKNAVEKITGKYGKI